MRQIFRNLIVLGALAGIIFTSLGCSGSQQTSQQATPTPLPTSIIPTKPTYVVERGDVSEELEFTARVAPVIQEELFFRTSGRVRGVYFEEGDSVKAGDVIADLEYLDSLERQLASDKLQLRRAEIQLQNAQVTLDLFQQSKPLPELVMAEAAKNLAEAEQAVVRAERNLGYSQQPANQASIDAAYAQMILAEQAVARARERFEPYANKPESNLTRAQLQAAVSAAERAYNTAVSQYNALTGSASQATQDVAVAELALAQARLLEAQAEWARVQDNPVPKGYDAELIFKQNDLELAQILYDETSIGVSDIESAIADAQLTAPFDGTLTTLRILDGRSADAFKGYAIVSDLSDLELSANLTSENMQRLEKGMPVTASLANRPGEIFTGSIRYLPYGVVSDGTESEKTTRITLDVEPENANLSVGDLVRVKIVLEHKFDVLWLPPQALRTFEGRRFVVVQDEGFQQRVDVKVGIESDDRIEIVEGLQEGQIVVAP